MRYQWRKRVWTTVVAAAGLLASTVASQAEVGPADADVMRPTQRGLCLTPALARAFGRIYISEEIENLANMSPEQVVQLTEAIARRSRRLVSDGGTDLRDACEGNLAMLLADDGNFGPETSRVFAERMPTILRVMRGFLDGLSEDGRRVLTPDQCAEIDRRLRSHYHDLKRLENKMRRWADGGFKENESPQLDDFEPVDGLPLQEEPEDPPRQLLRQTRRRAEFEVNGVGPGEWARFVASAKSTLEFDDEQAARAEAILAEYREEADAIMTPEWRAQMLTNRLRRQAYDFDYSQPTAPLRWRWDSEFRKACEPVEALGRAFRAAILELATDAQRQAVLADIEARAARHGWALERGDAELLGLAR